MLSSLRIATAAAGALYGFWLTSKSAFADTHDFLIKISIYYYFRIISIIIISSSSSSSSSIFIIIIIIIIISSIKDFLKC